MQGQYFEYGFYLAQICFEKLYKEKVDIEII